MPTRLQINQAAIAAARRHNVSPALYMGLIRAESGFNPKALSPRGAIGLAQLMPGTAAGFGVDPHNWMQNLEGGARYLENAMRINKGNLERVLASYNAGQGAVDQYGGIPPFKETQAYVPRVLQYMREFEKSGAGRAQASPIQAAAGAPSAAARARTIASQRNTPPILPGFIQGLIDQNAKIAGVSSFTFPEQDIQPTPIQKVAKQNDPTKERNTVVPPDSSLDRPGTGGWAGSKSHADVFAALAKQNGVGIMSEKRDRQHTTSGGVSDHWTGSKQSYAYDLSNGSNPTPEMDETAREIAAMLGVQGWKGGVLNVNRGGYRYQLLYRTNVGGNHYNHVHVGVKRL